MTGEFEGLPPVQLLFNYWELLPGQIAERLDRLEKRGVKEITTFVPWQVFEADVAHRLLRFIQAVVERDMEARLIVTPEVGVHYKNSGIPGDILSDREGLSQ